MFEPVETSCSQNGFNPDESSLSMDQNYELESCSNKESNLDLFSGEDKEFHIENHVAVLTVGEQKCQDDLEARNFGQGEEVLFEAQEYEEAGPEPIAENAITMHDDIYPYKDSHTKIPMILGEIERSENMDTSEKEEATPTSVENVEHHSIELDISHDDSSYSEDPHSEDDPPPEEVKSRS